MAGRSGDGWRKHPQPQQLRCSKTPHAPASYPELVGQGRWQPDIGAKGFLLPYSGEDIPALAMPVPVGRLAIAGDFLEQAVPVVRLASAKLKECLQGMVLRDAGVQP